MPETVVKIIIKDKFTNKLIALKLKEDTTMSRVIEILKKRYEHLVDKDIVLYLRNEELQAQLTLKDLIEKKNYTEKEKVEIIERKEPSASPAGNQVTAPAEPDFVKMMSKGGEEADKAILEILIRRRAVSRETGEAAWQVARQKKKPLVTVLIEEGYLAEKDILTNVSRHLEIPSVDLEGISVASEVLRIIPEKEAEYYGVLPISREQNVLRVAVANPFDNKKIQDLRLFTGMNIEAILAAECSIRAKIKPLYRHQVASEPASSDDGLPDELFNVPPTASKKPLVIKNGKRVGVEDISADVCAAETIWADKNEEGLRPLVMDAEEQAPCPPPAPVPAKQQKHPQPKGQIWEAPTVVNHKNMEIVPPPTDALAYPELRNTPEDALPAAIEIAPTDDKDSALPALEIPELKVQETATGKGTSQTAQESQAPDKALEISPENLSLGDAIPIYAGLNPDEVQGIAISPEAELQIPDATPLAGMGETKDPSVSDLMKTEKFGIAAKQGAKPPEAKPVHMPSELEVEMGVTPEDLKLESSLREEGLLINPPSQPPIEEGDNATPTTPALDLTNLQEEAPAKPDVLSPGAIELGEPSPGTAVALEVSGEKEPAPAALDLSMPTTDEAADGNISPSSPTAKHPSASVPLTDMVSEENATPTESPDLNTLLSEAPAPAQEPVPSMLPGVPVTDKTVAAKYPISPVEQAKVETVVAGDVADLTKAPVRESSLLTDLHKTTAMSLPAATTGSSPIATVKQPAVPVQPEAPDLLKTAAMPQMIPTVPDHVFETSRPISPAEAASTVSSVVADLTKQETVKGITPAIAPQVPEMAQPVAVAAPFIPTVPAGTVTAVPPIQPVVSMPTPPVGAQAVVTAKPATEPKPVVAPVPEPTMLPKISEKDKIDTSKKSEARKKKIAREVGVRYYRRMQPFHTFPLSVLFSHLKLSAPVSPAVVQTTGHPVEVKEEHPVVQVIPHLPGCLTVPAEMMLDITPPDTTARFWITPMAEGNIDAGEVEIRYQEKTLQRLPVQFKVAKQWPAKLAVICGLIAPFLTFLYDLHGIAWMERYSLLQELARQIYRVAAPLGGMLNLGLAIGALFLFLAVVLFFVRKAKQAKPMVAMLNEEI